MASAGRRLGIVEEPGEGAGDDPDDDQGGDETEYGPAHVGRIPPVL